MRSVLRLLGLILLVGTCAVAHADPVTYTLSNTPADPGYASGTGSFIINFAPSSTGVTTYSASDLSGFSFTFGNFTFTQAGVQDVVFTNGMLTSIDFMQTVTIPGVPGKTRPQNETLTISGKGYTLTNINFADTDANGNQTGGVNAVGVTPEPSSFWLLGTGLVGVAGAARKRLFGRGAVAQPEAITA